MSTIEHEKSIYLFMKEGSSDKEYHVHLRAASDGQGWLVQYANGPRGRVGKTALKTESPVSLDEARAIFDSLVKTKTKKGYTESASGVRFTNTEMSHMASGHVQQLPTAINREFAENLIRNELFAMQEKANGERCSIEVVNGVARGINKLGLYRDLPENIALLMGSFGSAFFDGELVGDRYFAFDLLSYKGKDLRSATFGERYSFLDDEVLNGMLILPSSALQLLHASFTEDGKREKLQRITEENGEGVVFKEVTAPYDAGRSLAAYKFKLVESATCVVTRSNSGRSVGIGLLNADGDLVDVGNVTVPSNHFMPLPDSLVEVQYLYFNPGGAFEQPVYLGPREDILRQECLLTQISRLKPGVGMDALGRRTEVADQTTTDATTATKGSAAPRARMRR